MSKSRRTRSMKTVDCREGCGNKMEIDSDSVSGMCWRCVNKMMAGPAGAYMHDTDDGVEEHVITPKDEDE